MTKKPRLVLDTNVVVSAVLWKGKPDQLLSMVEHGKVSIHTSQALLDELSDTLFRTKFAKRLERTGLSVEDVIQSYRGSARVVRTSALDRSYSRDPDEDHVIACAIAAKADFIVTGDDDLLVLGVAAGVRILRVTDMLTELA